RGSLFSRLPLAPGSWSYRQPTWRYRQVSTADTLFLVELARFLDVDSRHGRKHQRSKPGNIRHTHRRVLEEATDPGGAGRARRDVHLDVAEDAPSSLAYPSNGPRGHVAGNRGRPRKGSRRGNRDGGDDAHGYPSDVGAAR